MRFRIVPAVILSLLLFAGLTTAQTNDRDSIKRGNERYWKAEYQAAIAEYAKVSPSAGEVYAQALYDIGVCYYETWRTEDAVGMYRKALSIMRGNYPKASYALGVALQDLKRLPEAEDAYRQAVKSSGNKHALAYFKLGVLSLNGAGDPNDALRFFRQAISHSQDPFPNGHNNLGVALARAGRLSEAQGEFELALRQSKGTLDEARVNLELCRSLLLKRVQAQGDSVQASAIPSALAE